LGCAEYPDLHIRCHAYATPCVVSLDLAKKYRHLITSYVMGTRRPLSDSEAGARVRFFSENLCYRRRRVDVAGDDLVPRLSYGSMEELKGNILIVLAQEKGTVSRMFKLFAAGNALGAPRRAIAASSLPQSKRLALALAHASTSCVCVCVCVSFQAKRQRRSWRSCSSAMPHSTSKSFSGSERCSYSPRSSGRPVPWPLARHRTHRTRLPHTHTF
jgi:hypothetical protein